MLSMSSERPSTGRDHPRGGVGGRPTINALSLAGRRSSGSAAAGGGGGGDPRGRPCRGDGQRETGGPVDGCARRPPAPPASRPGTSAQLSVIREVRLWYDIFALYGK